MGDHVFDWRALRVLLDTDTVEDEALLGVDARRGSTAMASEGRRS
jgi:hypothetical protein